METNERTVLLLRGVPACGKTTYAKKLVDQGWNRVNKDDIREMINSYKLNNSDEKIVESIQDMAIILLMSKGRNIVIDNTHIKQKYIDNVERQISVYNEEGPISNFPKHEYHYNLKIQTLDTPLEVCIERNSKRDRPVPEEVIHSMYNSLHKNDQKLT